MAASNEAVHQVRAAEQSAATRRNLILAAMRLMAERGIDGVSLRAVNVAAGARNSSAAHYHFGDKMGLIEAVVDTISEQEAAVREPLVAQLRARGESEPVSVREAVEAAYLPFMGLFYQPEFGIQAIKFLSRLIADTAPDIRVVVNRFTEPIVTDLYDLAAPSLPNVPPRLLQARILFSVINLINGCADTFSLAYSPFGDMSYEKSLELASDFLEYIATGIGSSHREMTSTFEQKCNALIAQVQAGIGDSDGGR